VGYAARAGTSTPWSTGAERDSLIGSVNLADRAADRMGSAWPAIREWPELDDGFAAHAPVGSFLPNPFGLHDVHGNVAEWCRDVHRERSFAWPARPGDGLREGVEGQNRTARGGSYLESAASARCAYRLPFGRESRGPYLGLQGPGSYVGERSQALSCANRAPCCLPCASRPGACPVREEWS
jgi:formylglycine-generating enzyme required for sulfatase activity